MEDTGEKKLSHLDAKGQARMVDVSAKEKSERTARAHASVRMQPATIALVRDGKAPKGDVLATARVAGIHASKKTWDLIPLCHPIAITGVSIEFAFDDDGERLHVEASVKCADRTGVEMEALVAASVAALTLYDMLKAVDRAMTIERVELVEKTGGRSGHFVRSVDGAER